MKKFGFTLAEVLITLGIVGVVAALTAPALVTSSRNQANAARLSVTVSNLENALTTMIMQENADTLFQTQAWANLNNRPAFAGNIARYLHTNGYKNLAEGASDNVTKYYENATAPATLNATGGRNETESAWLLGLMARDPYLGTGTSHIIELKNGATLFFAPCRNQNLTSAQRQAIINHGGALSNKAAAVFIDVNGTSAPNTVGRDIFYFYLGENGVLYPIGGMDAHVFDSAVTPTWETACPVGGNITFHGLACTGRVISEGYSITY